MYSFNIAAFVRLRENEGYTNTRTILPPSHQKREGPGRSITQFRRLCRDRLSSIIQESLAIAKMTARCALCIPTSYSP